MKNLLICWIGNTDLQAPSKSAQVGFGPIAQAAESRNYDEIVLICDFAENKVAPYLKWLRTRTTSKIVIYYEKLSSPTNFGEIYEIASRVVKTTLEKHKEEVFLAFHLSPGTPAMAAVWVIIAKTRFPAELIESSKEHGVRTASVPFDISADFIPDLLSKPDSQLKQLSASLPPEAPEFANLVHRSKIMERIIAKARRVAPRSVPVLIEGESGTGKELLARALHKSSPRSEKPFVPVNCGAIPPTLIESELFGYEKGAFTGAHKASAGYFEAADEGTLFLDEIGELPLAAQVKILRALQEKEIVRIGSTKPIQIDVRIIAATNRTLSNEITAGRFRADLFYRLAVAILKLPPLRERQGDLNLLIDYLLAQINQESAEEPGYVNKKISAAARNIISDHIWPGNVRELFNTLRRAAIWSDGQIIQEDDIREALISIDSSFTSEILNKPLGVGLNIQAIMANVARHYLKRALEEAHGNKTVAAKLLGLPSYQTFTNWLDKYGIK
jgi:DNA-binding NtrC family response regulator